MLRGRSCGPSACQASFRVLGTVRLDGISLISAFNSWSFFAWVDKQMSSSVSMMIDMRLPWICCRDNATINVYSRSIKFAPVSNRQLSDSSRQNSLGNLQANRAQG